MNTKRRVKVFRNLHTGTWSVMQDGRVIGHPRKIHLRDCRFLVQPAGRKRVVQEKKKNVHAFVSGYLSSWREINSHNHAGEAVTYNPYKHLTFVGEDNQPILRSDFVDMDSTDPFAKIIAIYKVERGD